MAERELKGTGGGNFFKWPTGKYGLNFTGVFQSLGTGRYKDKETYHGVFVQDDGKTVKVNTPTILMDKLKQAEKGMRLSITYTADLPSTNGLTGPKDFRVLILGADGPPANYDAVATALRAKLGEGANTIIGMLATLYPSEPDKTAKLVDAARTYGVAV